MIDLTIIGLNEISEQQKEQKFIRLGTSDADLIKMCCSGQIEAFSILVNRYQGTLMNFLRSMNVKPHDLDDLAQEVWIKVYDYRFKYQNHAKFSTFLYMIAKQKVIDVHRKAKRWKKFTDIFCPYIQHKEKQRVQQELQKHRETDIELLMDRLSNEHREVIILRTQEKMSYQEISELLNVPIGTVKSRMHKAIKNLKSYL